MKWAIAKGHRGDNPAGEAIGAALPKTGAKREHFRALPHDRVSDALARIRESGAWWATRAAFEFLVLTAARSGEVRGARWEEVEGDVWTVPGERTKTGRAHRVPLSGRALEVLAEARERTGGEGLIFPARRGGMMSDMTISKLVKQRGIDAVPHGFRSSFRDWAAERTNIPARDRRARTRSRRRRRCRAGVQANRLLRQAAHADGRMGAVPRRGASGREAHRVSKRKPKPAPPDTPIEAEFRAFAREWAQYLRAPERTDDKALIDAVLAGALVGDNTDELRAAKALAALRRQGLIAGHHKHYPRQVHHRALRRRRGRRHQPGEGPPHRRRRVHRVGP